MFGRSRACGSQQPGRVVGSTIVLVVGMFTKPCVCTAQQQRSSFPHTNHKTLLVGVGYATVMQTFHTTTSSEKFAETFLHCVRSEVDGETAGR